MTTIMTSSQFGLEDMEALLWGPSSPMVDAMDFLSVCPDQEALQKRRGTLQEGDTSPVSPLTSLSPSSSSPPPFYFPPPSPLAVFLHGDKVRNESDLLSFPSLGHPGQVRQAALDESKEDMLSDSDWMTERVDFSEFDLESLIGSCSPSEESPSSPEDLLASLDCPMELDTLPLPTLPTPVLLGLPSPSDIPTLTSVPPPTFSTEPSIVTVEESESYSEDKDVLSPPLCVPEPQEELEIKSEPPSPDRSSPVYDSPSSPAYTLDLGSEVDVSESEIKPTVTSVIPQVQRVVLSISPTRIVLVLAPKEVAQRIATTTPEVLHVSPSKSCRSRPYPELIHKASPTCPRGSSGDDKPPRGFREGRPAVKTLKVRKLKKMEQNKTAATRYRQKKKYEKEALVDEYTMLERKNMELTEKAESMAREIEYLKELMEEVRQTRIKKGLNADP